MNTTSTSPWCNKDGQLKVILLALGERPEVAAKAAELLPQIQQHAEVLLSDNDFSEDLSRVEADLAIVLGGDGSILRAASQMAYNQIPVLGGNMGKLGFLAALDPDQLVAVLPDVCGGHCKVVDHLMFDCKVIRDGQVLASRIGLNEVTVIGGPPYTILDVELYVDSVLATTYSCDGLIISTPIGSTAHSLSTGGPILQKSLMAFAISPISPHTLTVRPVVDSADHLYEMVVREPGPQTSVVVDGQVLCNLAAGDRVCVEQAQPTFKMVEVVGHDYYRTLRDKLGWGGRLENKKGEPFSQG
jgi:NAD+ kinase